MIGVMRANGIIDRLSQIYDENHDVEVDFAWVDMTLLELCAIQQLQIETLDARIHNLEHPNYMEER